MTPRAARTPPWPAVRFAPDFLRRVERLLVRLAGARERREGAGRSAILGAGEEFVGYRPYRPGEDLRALDWSLLARLDRPFVRVTRREAGERWAVLVDASASMGVGPPGKLQRAAEVACALACLGLRVRARVRVLVSSARKRGAFELELARRGDPAALLAFLEERRAAGGCGLATLLATPRRFASAGRVFLVGDFQDLEPRALFGLVCRGRDLAALQLLAPVELDPPPAGAVEWWDPELGQELCMQVDRAAVGAYERSLERRLETWRTTCARHGITYGCWSSASAFEDVVQSILRLRT